MAGDANDDTYYWGRGEGNDSIDDSNSVDAVNPSNVDRILFRYGVTQADLDWQRQENKPLFTLTDIRKTFQIVVYSLSPVRERLR
ncbi:MAG: hypothetical protein AAGI24_16725 [Pseudomonadota bacterium]